MLIYATKTDLENIICEVGNSKEGDRQRRNSKEV